VPRIRDLLDQQINHSGALNDKERMEYAYEVLAACENEFRTSKKSN